MTRRHGRDQTLDLTIDHTFGRKCHGIEMPVLEKRVARRHGFEHFPDKSRKVLSEYCIKVSTTSRWAQPKKEVFGRYFIQLAIKFVLVHWSFRVRAISSSKICWSSLLRATSPELPAGSARRPSCNAIFMTVIAAGPSPISAFCSCRKTTPAILLTRFVFVPSWIEMLAVIASSI